MIKKLEKSDGQSMDIVENNIEQMKELFPEVFAEGKINFDRLQEVLGNYVVTDEDHYNFTWHGKHAAGRLAQTPSTGTLRPCPKESVNWDKTQNLFIEGDNLEVLKLLQKSYHRQIKMIYIDPPYNTDKDLIYTDDFKDGIKNYLAVTGQIDTDGNKIGTNTTGTGRYHTNWLNMIYPRLRLARNLLRDDGVIFISIDENEQNNLKCVCDQVFGEENFIECITWNKRVPKNDKGIGNIHEYILVYAKNAQLKPIFSMRKDGLEDIYDLVAKLKKSTTPLSDAEQEIKKLYKKNGYDRGITLYNSLDENYKLWGKINMSWPNSDTFGPTYEVLHPKTNKPVKIPDRGWRWKRETFDDAAGIVDGKYSNIKALHDGSYMCGRIWFAKDENTQPSSVNYLDDMDTFLLRSILSYKSDGGVEVESLFEGKSYFSYPKPTSLLRALLGSQPANDGDIYLDFFAGSCTSAHVVMQLNSEDGKHRRMISVQLPEPLDDKKSEQKTAFDFCKKMGVPTRLSEISKERIRRAANKVKEENPLFSGDLGFKVFKLDTSNIKTWEAGFDTLKDDLIAAADYIKQDRSSDDIVFELLLKYGLNLTVPIEIRTIGGKKVYSIGIGALVVCLDSDVSMETINGIGALKEELKPEIMRVVFKDSGFKDDVVKTNALQTLKRFGIEDIKSL